MSKFTGYTADQRYRVVWNGGASESMTLDEARLWLWEREGDGVAYWVEEYNGWEWVKAWDA